MTAPESILFELAADAPTVGELISGIGPLMVPFDTLADIDGWVVALDAADPSAAFDDPALGADQRAVNAALLAVDYAIRRGATSVDSVVHVLRREGPVAFSGLERASEEVRRLVERVGLASGRPDSFARRARGHDLSEPVDSDPALSFEERAFDYRIGDNALSSLLVHSEGERNAVEVTGEPSDRWAVEVGLPATAPEAELTEIEREIALMPSFIHGLSSELDDDGIVVGWRHGHDLDPGQIGLVIQAWTRALFDLEFADVRIVFGPAHGASGQLTEMRGRASEVRRRRMQTQPESIGPSAIGAEFWRGVEQGS